MKLLRMFWERPSTLHKSHTDSGIFYKECEDDNSIEEIIEERKKMCEEENANRIIRKVEVYNFERCVKITDAKLKDMPIRKVWTIDVGNLPKDEAEQYINILSCKIKNKQYKRPSRLRRFLRAAFGWMEGYHC